MLTGPLANLIRQTHQNKDIIIKIINGVITTLIALVTIILEIIKYFKPNPKKEKPNEKKKQDEK